MIKTAHVIPAILQPLITTSLAARSEVHLVQVDTSDTMHALNISSNTCSCKCNAARQSSCNARINQQHRQQVGPVQQHSSHVCKASGTNAAALVAAAAVILQSCVTGPQAAAAAGVQQQQQQWQQQRQHLAQPIFGDLAAAAAAPALEEEEDDVNLQEIEDDIMAQVAIPQELTNFMQMLQKVGVAQ
jgi:hypothetical protein